MSAYRADDDADVIEAKTAEGPLRLSLGPRHIQLAVAQRTLHIADRFATLIDHRKKDRRTSLRIDGNLVCARDVPRDDLGIWIELDGGMRRIFGVEPINLMHADGLAALASLDRLTYRLRAAFGPLAGDIRRATELGRGLDKVLLADHGDRIVVWARRLFRDRARIAIEVHADGRVVVPDGKKAQHAVVRSRYGVTVVGDLVRFADPHGADLASVAIPWIEPEDRRELARRLGQLVDRETGPAVAEGGEPHTGDFGLQLSPAAAASPAGKGIKRLRWLVPNRRR